MKTFAWFREVTRESRCIQASGCCVVLRPRHCVTCDLVIADEDFCFPPTSLLSFRAVLGSDGSQIIAGTVSGSLPEICEQKSKRSHQSYSPKLFHFLWSSEGPKMSIFDVMPQAHTCLDVHVRSVCKGLSAANTARQDGGASNDDACLEGERAAS